jgi:hypothetical protein
MVEMVEVGGVVKVTEDGLEVVEGVEEGLRLIVVDVVEDGLRLVVVDLTEVLVLGW